MRYLRGHGYTIFVYVLPIIFLSFEDCFSNLVVEAPSNAVSEKNGDPIYDGKNERGSSYEEIQGSQTNTVVPTTVKTSLKQKLPKILIVGAVAAILITLGFGIKRGIQYVELESEKKKFREEMNTLIESARELKGVCYNFMRIYTGSDSEVYELLDHSQSLASIHKYQNEFFRNTSKSEIEIKQRVWRVYLYPFLKALDLKSKPRSKVVVETLKKWAQDVGFVDEALATYDITSLETPKINTAALNDYINALKQKEGNFTLAIERLEYFAANYEKFFSIRRRYYLENDRIYQMVLAKHPDVAYVRKPRAKSVMREKQ